MTCKWRRNGDEWTVVGPAEQIATGKVTVYRKDGRVKVVTIARMSQPWEYQGTLLARGWVGGDR